MTWLIGLYPRAWRRRYGRELADLLATQPASFRTAVDLVAGAIDAWLNPQTSTAGRAADSKGDGAMVSKMLQLKCAGHAPTVTAADHRKAAVITVGGTIALMIPFLLVSARYGRSPYFLSLVSVSWLVPYVVSQHYTTLKGRPWVVQSVLIGGQAVFVIGVALAAAWVGASVHH